MVVESRRVISLWLPRLATDRLSRRGPLAAWRERPLATVHAVQGGLRITAANAPAQVAGISPALPIANARALCPDLKIVEADLDGDMAVLAALADWCGRYTPWTAVEALGEDGAGGLWLDISGCAHLFGGEDALVRDLVARMAELGFAARAGLADTPGGAWAAARFLAGEDGHAVVPEGATRQLLAGLPVAALRLPPAVVEILHRLGLRRIGDLLPLPRAPLAARFGDAVRQRLDQLLGHSPEPISPRRPALPYFARLAFAEPIGRDTDVAAGLRRLLDILCDRLRRGGQGARHLELALYRIDGIAVRTAIGTVRASRDPAHLARLFTESLAKLEIGFGIEVMTLAARVVEPLAGEQGTLAARSGRSDGELELLVDRLANRLGRDRIRRLAPRETHLPEKAVRPVAPLGPMKDAVWPQGPRPLRLLARPEAIEAVLEAGEVPTAFRWRRQRHRITRADGPERVAAEWWHAATPPPPDAVRDYWRIEDAEGRRFWLFREGRGGWYMHGVFA